MFERVKRVHIVGIGGIGVSALAQFFLHLGKKVEGCDLEETPWISSLRGMGMKIAIGHDERHIEKADLVVHSLALPSNHPELEAARKHHIPTLSYPEALGIITRHFFTIAVCGTHGKTTTTAMLAKLLIENGYDPYVIVGSLSPDLNGQNFRSGKKKILVLEACEYQNAFLHYSPNIILMTNIDHDHFDAFPTFASYFNAFQKFAARLPKDGYFFGNGDDKNVAKLFKNLKSASAYNRFSLGTKSGTSRFRLNGKEVLFDGKPEGVFSLKIAGKHNLMNVLGAYAVGRIFNMASHDILASLNTYQGSARRMELKGVVHGVKVYDDYAHHPTEVKATLQALREMHPKEKICVVYQPHQFSRTQHLLKEFGKAFLAADCVVIPNIYQARDSQKSLDAVSVQKLVQALKKNGTKAFDGGGFDKTASWLKQNHEKFLVVVLMGAGDVWKIYRLLTK